jgi:hypothetical protein
MAQVGIGAVQGWLKGGPKMAQEQQWRGPMTVQGWPKGSTGELGGRLGAPWGIS